MFLFKQYTFQAERKRFNTVNYGLFPGRLTRLKRVLLQYIEVFEPEKAFLLRAKQLVMQEGKIQHIAPCLKIDDRIYDRQVSSRFDFGCFHDDVFKMKSFSPVIPI